MNYPYDMKKSLKILFIFLIAFLIIPICLYFISFHGSLSKETEDWLCFSSVLSASIGTAISAITLFILLLDRKTSDNERKTNQFIDYLFRQNTAITKNFVANGYVEIPIEQKFGEINSHIEDEYCSITLFNYLKDKKLSNCPEEIQNYFIRGYCVASNQSEPITAAYFDNKITDEWILKAIQNAPINYYEKTIRNSNDTLKSLSNSNIKDNIEALRILDIKCNYSILNNCFKNKNISSRYPYSISAFINTYRYALLHLLEYKPGLSLYFSQLSLEQKIFIAFDIVSMDNQSVLKILNQNKWLLHELLTEEVLKKCKLLSILYHL